MNSVKDDCNGNGTTPEQSSLSAETGGQYSPLEPLECSDWESPKHCAQRQAIERNLRATNYPSAELREIEEEAARYRNAKAAAQAHALTESQKPPVMPTVGRWVMPTPADRKKIKEGDSPFHFDSGKPRVDHLPPRALMEVSRVLGYGAKKYGEWNWAEYANDWKWGQMIGSLLRHVFAWMMRQDIDPESGLHHLAHAGCNLLMLLELVLTENGADDRSPIGT